MATDQPRSTFADVEDLVAQAMVLPDPAEKRAFGDVKLPPAELVDDLDNSDAKPPGADEPADEPVTLDFFGDDLPFKSFPLKHPFRWRERDVRVEVVEIHQLTTAQVGTAVQEQDAGTAISLDDLYCRMTRVAGTELHLTTSVLQKMPHVDGAMLRRAGYDFLPPFFRPEGG